MNYNTQNAKIASITEKTLIIGIDVGSETHYARAFTGAIMSTQGSRLLSATMKLDLSHSKTGWTIWQRDMGWKL